MTALLAIGTLVCFAVAALFAALVVLSVVADRAGWLR